jgi:hypothetical protein
LFHSFYLLFIITKLISTKETTKTTNKLPPLLSNNFFCLNSKKKEKKRDSIEKLTQKNFPLTRNIVLVVNIEINTQQKEKRVQTKVNLIEYCFNNI